MRVRIYLLDQTGRNLNVTSTIGGIISKLATVPSTFLTALKDE